jgi:hypothetical protein
MNDLTFESVQEPVIVMSPLNLSSMQRSKQFSALKICNQICFINILRKYYGCGVLMASVWDTILFPVTRHLFKYRLVSMSVDILGQ